MTLVLLKTDCGNTASLIRAPRLVYDMHGSPQNWPS